MNKFVATSIVALAAGIFAAPALAADLGSKGAITHDDAPVASKNWTGPYIALGAGYNANSIDIGEGGESVSISADGLIVTGRIGYDRQFGSFVVGVFGDIDWNNASAAIKEGSVSAFEPDFSYSLGGRVGLPLGGAMPYVNAGWEWQHFKKSDVVGSYDPDGFFIGGGIEAALLDGFSIAVEGRKTWASDSVTELGDADNGSYRGMVFIKKSF